MENGNDDDVRRVLARDRGRKRPGHAGIVELHVVSDVHIPDIIDEQLIDNDEHELIDDEPDNISDIVVINLDALDKLFTHILNSPQEEPFQVPQFTSSEDGRDR